MTKAKNKTEIELNDELEKLRSGLSTSQMMWAELYQSGMTPAEALKESGLDTGDKLVDTAAAKSMHESPRVRLYMDALNRQVAVRSVMSLEAVDAVWADIASVSVADMIEIGELYESLNEAGLPSGAPVQGIKLKSLDELTQAQRIAIKKVKPCPGGVEIELYDKMKALEMIAKRHQAFTEKIDVNVSGDVQVVTFVGDNGRGPKKDFTQ